MSIGVALKDCRPKDQPHGLVETVGAGARKSGCFSNLLGWSFVRDGASDLDEHTLVSERAFGNQPSCSLPLKAESLKVEMACLVPEWC